MFSINPSYDYQHGEYANGSATERMGPLPPVRGGGRGHLRDEGLCRRTAAGARTSPFGQALTEYQCIPVRPGQARRPDGAARCPRPGGSGTGPGLSAGWGGGAGLLRHQLPHPQRRGGHLRLLPTTASPAPPAWTWASSTSIMTWPVRGMPWRQSTTGTCLWVRMPASAAATVTAGAPSMYPSRRGCGRSHPTSGRREGPGRSLHLCRLHQ